MSLIESIENHLRQGRGLIEFVPSEAEFKNLRSILLRASLSDLRGAEGLSTDEVLNLFATRRLLNLEAESIKSFAPTFDINDMMNVVERQGITLEELLNGDALLPDLKNRFQILSCEEKQCGLSRIEIGGMARFSDLEVDSIVFVGPIYVARAESQHPHEVIQWAFRESRQNGIRRFLIEDEIKHYPSFDSSALEREVLELGYPSRFIPLERSLSNIESEKSLNNFLLDYVQENRSVDTRILCGLFAFLSKGSSNNNIELKSLFPLNGSFYCSGCHLVIRENEHGKLQEVSLAGHERTSKKTTLNKNYSRKVLGLLSHQLNDLTLAELVDKVRTAEAEYKLPESLDLVPVESLTNTKLSSPFKDLSFNLKLLFQLAFIQVAKVKGVIFFVEILESEYRKEKARIDEATEAIKKNGNAILFCITSKLQSSKRQTTKSQFTYSHKIVHEDDFQEFVLEGNCESPLVVDLLGLRTNLFELYARTKEARLIGFSTQDYQSKSELHCRTCKGRGYLEEKLLYGYRAVAECSKCSGTGLNIKLGSITSYGIKLKECFQGSLSDLIGWFEAEPDFLLSHKAEIYRIQPQSLRINALISELNPINRAIILELLK